MSPTIFVFLLAVAIASAGVIGNDPEKQIVPVIIKKCGRNEVWTECGSCENTCRNPEPLVCAAVCRMGCVCKKGHLRNKEGHCVRPCDC